MCAHVHAVYVCSSSNLDSHACMNTNWCFLAFFTPGVFLFSIYIYIYIYIYIFIYICPDLLEITDPGNYND